MTDVFDRVLRIAQAGNETVFGSDWSPLDLRRENDYDVLLPDGETEDRLVYVYTYEYAKHGVHPDAKERQHLFEEKRTLAAQVRAFHEHQSAYVYRADYCEVHAIAGNGKCLGYDFIVRCREYLTLEDYLRSEQIQDRLAYLLRDPSEEAEQVRVAMADRLLHRICLALKECHRIGAVHGRINLRNVWIVNSETEKEEFLLSLPGIGRFNRTAADDRRMLDEYSAPELSNDPAQPFDEQTDLYSLGVLLYQLLNEGRMPFAYAAADSVEELRIRYEGRTEIPEPRHGTPLLRYITRKLLANSRSHRYQTAEELESDSKRKHNKADDADALSVITVSDVKLREDEEERKRQEAEAGRLQREEEHRKKEEAAAAEKKKGMLGAFVGQKSQQKQAAQPSYNRPPVQPTAQQPVPVQPVKPARKRNPVLIIILVVILLVILLLFAAVVLYFSQLKTNDRAAVNSEVTVDSSMAVVAVSEIPHTETPTDPPTTEVSTEPTTVAPTEPMTETPTEPTTESLTEAMTALQFDSNGVLIPDFFSEYSSYGSGEVGYCTADSTYIYKMPSSDGTKREADKLYKGDAVTVYGKYNSYYYIGTDSGSGYELVGYVDFTDISLGTPPDEVDKSYTATYGYVDVESCNVRSSPSKENDFNITDKLFRGQEFTINSFDGYWYSINYDGKTGYVSYKMVAVY